MDNFVQKGEVLTLTPPVGGVTGGLGYQIGQIFAVATKTVTAAEALAGVSFEGYVGPGVVNLAKTAGDAPTEGALAYWDDAAGSVTVTATGNLLIGHFALAAGAADAAARVRLDGAARDNEAT